jgi:long-chain acyl-CoA synthetase
VSQTRLEWVLCDLAIMLAGGIAVPIYASNTAEQCEFIVRDAGAKVVMVEDAAQRDKLVALAATSCSRWRTSSSSPVELPCGSHRRRRRPVETVPSRFSAVAGGDSRGGTAVGVAHSPASWTPMPRRSALESLFTIIYTSGTTGIPKGVVLTHDQTLEWRGSAARFAPCRSRRWTCSTCSAAGARAGPRARSGRRSRWVRDRVLARQPRKSRKTSSRSVRPSWQAVPRIFEKFYAGVKAALEQGSGLKRKIAAWALRVGAAQSAAVRAGKPGGGFAYWLADRLVFSKLRARWVSIARPF